MDFALSLLLVVLGIITISTAISVIYGGIILGTIIVTIGVVGLAFIPATPIIPPYIAVTLIIIEVVFISLKLAGMFSFSSGNTGGAS